MRCTVWACVAVFLLLGLMNVRADEPAESALGTAAQQSSDTPRPLPPRGPIQPAPARQLLVQIQILELKQQDLRAAGWDVTEGQFVQLLPDLPRAVDKLRKAGHVRVLAEPSIVTLSGRAAQFRSGSEVKIWDIGPDGKPVECARHVGTSVDCTAHLLDHGDVLARLRVAVSELDPARTVVVAGKTNPAICQRAVDTTVKAKLGETIALAGLAHRSSEAGAQSTQATVQVMLATIEAFEPVAARPAATPVPLR